MRPYPQLKIYGAGDVNEVTIGLACLNISNQEFMLRELENSKAIAEGLAAVAVERGDKPPRVTVSILFDHSASEKLSDSEYNKYKESILAMAKKFTPPLFIEDFCAREDLTDDEKYFLKDQRSIVNRIDIIKTHASAYSKGNHLVIDSNTICSDFEELYDLTFGSAKPYQVNACWYDLAHVTCQNKVWYATIGSEFKIKLKEHLIEFMKHAADDPEEKTPKKNSIFNKVFCPALADLRESPVHINTDPADGWIWYVADLAHECYRVSSSIFVSLKMSWADPDRPDAAAIQKPMNDMYLEHKSAKVDFGAIYYIVKKYTSMLERHLDGNGGIDLDEYSRFLELFNTKKDLIILAMFFNKAKDLPDDPEHIFLKQLINLIPNTQRGNLLIQLLWNVKEEEVGLVRKNPEKYRANEMLEERALEKFKQETIYLHTETVSRVTTHKPSHEL